MFEYLLLFISKALLGAAAIVTYQATADLDNDAETTMIYAMLSAVLTVACMGITFWQLG